MLENTENDLFDEISWYFFMSYWDAYAGHFADAHAHLDSIIIFCESQLDYCSQQDNRRFCICSRRNFSTYHADRWLKSRKRSTCYLKSILFLREHKTDQAREIFSEALAYIEPGELALRRRLEGSFNYFFSIYNQQNAYYSTTLLTKGITHE